MFQKADNDLSEYNFSKQFSQAKIFYVELWKKVLAKMLTIIQNLV